MERYFNISGTCFSDKHYMVDLSGQLAEIFTCLSDVCTATDKPIVDCRGKQYLIEMKIKQSIFRNWTNLAAGNSRRLKTFHG